MLNEKALLMTKKTNMAVLLGLSASNKSVHWFVQWVLMINELRSDLRTSKMQGELGALPMWDTLISE